jgi:cell division protease FtsH
LNPFYKNLALWLVITLMMVMLYNLFSQQHMAETNISYSEFLNMVENERIAEVVIQGQELLVTDTNHNRFLPPRIPGTCPCWYHGFQCWC